MRPHRPHEYHVVCKQIRRGELEFLCHTRAEPHYLREQHRGMAAVQQNISYKRELLAGDIVEVRSRVLEVGEKSLRFLHEMWNIDARELAASCELTGVHMDRRERKAVSFPEAVRDAALANIAAAG